MQTKNNALNTQLLYQVDPTRLEFEAHIQQKFELTDGRYGIILDHTFFYPTGGGQEHDVGLLGDARVLEVFKDDSIPLRIVHVVDREIKERTVTAKIDPEYRLRLSQHHTAQHLLTYCFSQIIKAETVSANINGKTPSTLDLDIHEIHKSDLDRVESLANSIIYENREVKSYIIPGSKVQDIPLRKPPTVNKNIRVIEIDALDYSACGGTHVSKTGSIGLIKITRTERVNERLRIHFVAGWQAFGLFCAYYETFGNLGSQLSVNPLELPQVYQRMNDQLVYLIKELETYQHQLINREASSLYEQGHLSGNQRFVQGIYANRSIPEIRLLADVLRKYPRTISILINKDGQKITVLVTCAEDSRLSARELLLQLLNPINGRGGGDDTFAQGGGRGNEEQIADLITVINTIKASYSL